MKSTEIVEYLHDVPLFRTLSRAQLQRLARVTRVRESRKGEAVVREGTYRSGGGPAFYLVAEGRGTVTVKRKKVGTVKPGDTFGEMSLLDGQPRSATITADTDMVLLRILSNDFMRLVRTEPAVAVGLLKTLAGWLRASHKSKLD